MLSREELEKKMEEHFECFGGDVVVKDFGDLHKFIWDYANQSWREGRKFGANHSGD